MSGTLCNNQIAIWLLCGYFPAVAKCIQQHGTTYVFEAANRVRRCQSFASAWDNRFLENRTLFLCGTSSCDSSRRLRAGESPSYPRRNGYTSNTPPAWFPFFIILRLKIFPLQWYPILYPHLELQEVNDILHSENMNFWTFDKIPSLLLNWCVTGWCHCFQYLMYTI